MKDGVMPGSGRHCPLPPRPWARAAPRVWALTCQTHREGTAWRVSAWQGFASPCGCHRVPTWRVWAPHLPVCTSAPLSGSAHSRGADMVCLLYKGLSCSPHPTGGVPKEFPGILPVPQPLASHRRPSCLVPTLAPTLSGVGGVPSAPCPCPLRPQAAAWCWAGSSLEGYRVTPGRTHPGRAGSAKDSRVPRGTSTWGCPGAARRAPPTPRPGPAWWPSLSRAAVGLGESRHLVFSGAWSQSC